MPFSLLYRLFFPLIFTTTFFTCCPQNYELAFDYALLHFIALTKWHDAAFYYLLHSKKKLTVSYIYDAVSAASTVKLDLTLKLKLLVAHIYMSLARHVEDGKCVLFKSCYTHGMAVLGHVGCAWGDLSWSVCSGSQQWLPIMAQKRRV